MNVCDKVKEIIASVLECSIESLNEQSGLLLTYNWDSLNHVTIIYEIEDTFNVKIPDEKIVELNNVNAIIEFVEKERNI